MKNGKYELVIAPEDYPGKKYRGRYAYEHHVVFWESNGRIPSPGCVIHHKNDSKRENDISNLEEKQRWEHSADHSRKGRTVLVKVCGWCKEEFVRDKNKFKKRMPISTAVGRTWLRRSGEIGG